MHAAYPLSQLDAPVCSDMCSTGQEFFGTRALTCPRAFLSNRGRCKTFSRHLATRRDPVPEMVRISTTLFPSTMKYHALVVREIKYEWIAMDHSFNRVAIPNRKLSRPGIDDSRMSESNFSFLSSPKPLSSMLRSNGPNIRVAGKLF